MAQLCRFIIYILIFKYAMAKPISVESVRAIQSAYEAQQQESRGKDLQQRQGRQVVQPTWLTQESNFALPIDPAVHVNAQNLREAAELRKEIQQAVQDGSYAVPAFDGQQQTPAKHGVSQLQYPQWNFQYAGPLPQWSMQPTAFTWQQLQVQAQQYIAALQQRWLQMLTNANGTPQTN